VYHSVLGFHTSAWSNNCDWAVWLW